MIDELRAWLKGVEKRRDRALTAFGDDHAFADAVLDCVNADMSDLIAKVEELAGALELLASAARGVPHNGDNLVMGTLDVAIEDAETALRAPGGEQT